MDECWPHLFFCSWLLPPLLRHIICRFRKTSLSDRLLAQGRLRFRPQASEANCQCSAADCCAVNFTADSFKKWTAMAAGNHAMDIKMIKRIGCDSDVQL